MIKEVKTIIVKLLKIKLRIFFSKRDKWVVKDQKLPKLTSEEMQAIKSTWPCFSFKMKDLVWMRLYKKEHGFSPYYLCDFQYSYVLDCLNPRGQVEALTNKGLYDIYFPGISFPQVILRNINGVFYDGQLAQVDFKGAVDCILQYGKDFIIKPTLDTGGGKGVQRIVFDNCRESRERIEEILCRYNKNFIVQEVLESNSLMAGFNPTSLNTCRVTTIYMKGEVSSYTILKFGKKDAKVDNWSQGYYLGVTSDGRFMPYGYDNHFNKIYRTDSGVEFSGVKLEGFEEMVSYAQKNHVRYFPQCGIIGWDIVIDKENKPKVIEINLKTPGIRGEQLCLGPVFEKYNKNICDILQHKLS